MTGLTTRIALGPQVAWRTVYIVEYLGPLLIHPLFYFLRPWIYHTDEPPSELQTISLILITLHFLKRELETIFVHRFTLATLPAIYVLRNSAYYWIVCGLNVAYWIYRPTGPTARPSDPIITSIGVALYVIGEVCNFSTHMTLRNLRKADGLERGIPQGLGFNLVTSPNYMFEAVAWLGIWIVTWSLSTGIFLFWALWHMMDWAKKKERRNRKDFGAKYQNKRYGVIPGIY